MAGSGVETPSPPKKRRASSDRENVENVENVVRDPSRTPSGERENVENVVRDPSRTPSGERENVPDAPKTRRGPFSGHRS